MLSDSPWFSLLGMIVIMAAIIGLAYWFTRYIVGGNQMRSMGLLQKNDQLLVLAQTPIGKDQRLAVVRQGHGILLSVLQHRIFQCWQSFQKMRLRFGRKAKARKGMRRHPPFSRPLWMHCRNERRGEE